MDKGIAAAGTLERIEGTYRDRGTGFLAWARRHAPDAETAEDALQDAFLKAVANLDALAPVEDLAAWIFTAMRNRIVDLWRARKTHERAGERSVPEEVLGEIASTAGYDPNAELVRVEVFAAIEEEIAALPAAQREILQAQTRGGETFREIAERTGTSIDTLMARKRYAVKKLAVALEEWMDEE
jgi:RNA polymerase sigma factor (sigma-70 family)